nr:ATP-grasp domain-containing protein [uncultured Desulfobacter sp.]
MRRVLLITGPGGDAQGWGDMAVTQEIEKAVNGSGKSADIAFVSDMDELTRALDTRKFDIVWSALYHITENEATIGRPDGDHDWVADILDKRRIPYIGPDAATMKALIHKTATHNILDEAGVPVPYHYQIDQGHPLPEIVFPAFVKPSFESRSVGISDNSVVNTVEELAAQVRFIHENYDQPALVEEYLPGREYTVLMLGNGRYQEFLPGMVTVDPKRFGKYPILSANLRGVGATKIQPAGELAEKTIEIAAKATKALNCMDHVRADMRLDSHGNVKIIEVNGIPGLKPVKSWSPQLYTLHHVSKKGQMEDYRLLIDHIVSSALTRYGIT